MNTRKPRGHRPVRVELLEDRVNPSGMTGVSAMINSATLIAPIENAYASFANSVRTAEIGLLGSTPVSPSSVAAEADQAIAQLDAQLNAALVQTPGAAESLMPLIQTQLTGSGVGSLTNSMNSLFSASVRERCAPARIRR